eukprot:8356376-Alexandrium_andersonii.AAC.1
MDDLSKEADGRNCTAAGLDQHCKCLLVLHQRARLHAFLGLVGAGASAAEQIRNGAPQLPAMGWG